jgi:hypothetical protein
MLDEVDEDFELKQQRDKARISKYKRIAESLETSSSSDNNGGHNRGGSTEEDISVPAAFGRAVSKAIRKGVIGRGLVRRHLDEGGVDIDAQNDFFGEGDYSKTHADDEEENVGVEQAELEEREANVAGKVITGVVDSLGSDKNEEFEENDEDDEDEFGGDPHAFNENEDGLINGKDPLAGMLADDLDRSARELGRKMAEQTAQLAAAREAEEGGTEEYAVPIPPTTINKATFGSTGVNTASSATGSGRVAGVKTGAPSEEGSAAKRRKGDQIQAPGSVATVAAVVQSAASTTGAKKVIELTEDCVRQYLISMGGKAPISGVKEVYCSLIWSVLRSNVV